MIFFGPRDFRPLRDLVAIGVPFVVEVAFFVAGVEDVDEADEDEHAESGGVIVVDHDRR